MADKSNAKTVSRRSFLRAAAVGSTAPYFIPSGVLAAPGKVGPNDKINVALIGANGQGNYDLDNVRKQHDAVITGVCDVSTQRREKTLGKCKDAKGYNDYREVLANKDVDAVIIASSPHWHARMSVDAAEAKKDFYCEKPMTLHLAESIAVVNAAKKHERVTQVGTQIHATKNYHRVVDVVRSGVLGKISTVRTFHVLNQGPNGIGMVPDSDPPKDVDWDMWIGPAENHKFNELLFKSSYFHPSWMISGGWTPGMAPHIIDLPIWALDLGFPTTTFSTGGRYVIKDCGDAYDFQECTWQYPNFTLSFWTSMINNYAYNKVLQASTTKVGRRRGQFYHGVNGTMIADYEYMDFWSEDPTAEDNSMTGLKDFKVADVPKAVPDSVGHHREWLNCIRTREQPSCNVAYHHKVNTPITLAMLSMKLGRSIQFDGEKQIIVGDAEASKAARPVYREPWKFMDEYVPAL